MTKNNILQLFLITLLMFIVILPLVSASSNNLILNITFDNSSDPFRDYSSLNHHFDTQGGASYAVGDECKYYGCGNFTATANDYINSTSKFNLSTGVAFSFWVQKDADVNSYYFLWGYNYDGNKFPVDVALYESGYGMGLNLAANDGKVGQSIGETQEIPINTWTHYFALYNTTVIKIWKNGVLLTDSSQPYGNINNSYLGNTNYIKLGIGHYGIDIEGYIDEFLMWNTTNFTTTDVVDLYDSRRLGTPNVVDVYVEAIKYDLPYNWSHANNSLDETGTMDVNFTIKNVGIENSGNIIYNFTLNNIQICNGITTLDPGINTTIVCPWTKSLGFHKGWFNMTILSDNDTSNNIQRVYIPFLNRPFFQFNMTEYNEIIKPYASNSSNVVAYDSWEWIKGFTAMGSFNNGWTGNAIDPYSKNVYYASMGCLVNDFADTSGRTQCYETQTHLNGWANRTLSSYNDIQALHMFAYAGLAFDKYFQNMTKEQYDNWSIAYYNIAQHIATFYNFETDDPTLIAGGNGKGFGDGGNTFMINMLGVNPQNPTLIKDEDQQYGGGNLIDLFINREVSFLRSYKNDSSAQYQEGSGYAAYAFPHLLENYNFYKMMGWDYLDDYDNALCSMAKEFLYMTLDDTYNGNTYRNDGYRNFRLIQRGDSYSFAAPDNLGVQSWATILMSANLCDDENINKAALYLFDKARLNGDGDNGYYALFMYKKIVDKYGDYDESEINNYLSKFSYDNANDIFLIRRSFTYTNDTVIQIDGGDERAGGHAQAQGYFLYAMGEPFLDYEQVPYEDDVRMDTWKNGISLQNTSQTVAGVGGIWNDITGDYGYNQYYGENSADYYPANYPDFRALPLEYGGDLENYISSDDGTFAGVYDWKPYFNADIPVREYNIIFNDILVRRIIVDGNNQGNGTFNNFINIANETTETRDGTTFIFNRSNKYLKTQLIYDNSSNMILGGGKTNILASNQKTSINNLNVSYRRMYYYTPNNNTEFIFSHDWYYDNDNTTIQSLTSLGDEGLLHGNVGITPDAILFDVSGDNMIAHSVWNVTGWGLAFYGDTKVGAFNTTSIKKSTTQLFTSNNTISVFIEPTINDELKLTVNTMKRRNYIDFPETTRVTLDISSLTNNTGGFNITKNDGTNVAVVSNTTNTVTFDVISDSDSDYYLVKGGTEAVIPDLLTCGDTITSDYTMSADIDCTTLNNNVIILDTPNTVFNGNGHTIIGTKNYSGIYITANNITVNNVTFTNNRFGIRVSRYKSGIRIENSSFYGYNNFSTIYVESLNNSVIAYNTFTNITSTVTTRGSIDLVYDDSHDISIHDNYFNVFPRALATGTSNLFVYNNIFINSTSGSSAIQFNTAENITMYNNTFNKSDIYVNHIVNFLSYNNKYDGDAINRPSSYAIGFSSDSNDSLIFNETFMNMKGSIAIYGFNNIIENSSFTNFTTNVSFGQVFEGTNIIYRNNYHKDGMMGIYSYEGTNLTFKNNYFENLHDDKWKGMFSFSRPNGVKIINNTAIGFPRGVTTNGIKNLLIENNTFDRGDIGLSIWNAENVTIRNNIILNMSKNVFDCYMVGIYLYNVNNSIVEDTSVQYGSVGMWIQGGKNHYINNFTCDQFSIWEKQNGYVDTCGWAGTWLDMNQPTECILLAEQYKAWTSHSDEHEIINKTTFENKGYMPVNITVGDVYFDDDVQTILSCQGCVNLTENLNPDQYWYRRLGLDTYKFHEQEFWNNNNVECLSLVPKYDNISTRWLTQEWKSSIDGTYDYDKFFNYTMCQDQIVILNSEEEGRSEHYNVSLYPTIGTSISYNGEIIQLGVGELNLTTAVGDIIVINKNYYYDINNFYNSVYYNNDLGLFMSFNPGFGIYNSTFAEDLSTYKTNSSSITGGIIYNENISAYESNYISGSLNVPKNAATSNLKNFSMIFTINSSNINSNVILRAYGTLGSDGVVGFQVGVVSYGRLQVSFYNVTEGHVYTNSANYLVDTNTTTTIGISVSQYNSTDVKIDYYRNGLYFSTSYHKAKISVNPTATMSFFGAGSSYFDGSIYNILLYNKTLTSAEQINIADIIDNTKSCVDTMTNFSDSYGNWKVIYDARQEVTKDYYYTDDDSANLAWGEGYILQSYINMYNIQQNKSYLDLFVTHVDTMISNRSDVNNDGYISWYTPRYSYSKIGVESFENSDEIIANWTFINTTFGSSVVMDSIIKYSGTYSLQFDTNITNAEIPVVKRIFNEYSNNSKYAVNFYYKTSNTYIVMKVIDETTNELLYTENFTNTGNIVQNDWRYTSFYTPVEEGHNISISFYHNDPTIAGTIWLDYVKVNKWVNYMVHDGQIFTPISQFINIVKDENLNEYTAKSNTYLEIIENEVIPHYEDCWEEWGNEGVYLDGCSDQEGQVSIRQYANVTRAVNWYASLGNVIYNVYKTTENPIYYNKLSRLGNFIKNQCFETTENNAYQWNYICLSNQSWDDGESTTTYEDTSHGQIDLTFMKNLIDINIFDDIDKERILNTFFINVWSNTCSNIEISDRLDGSGTKNLYRNGLYGFMKFSEYDYSVYKIVEKIMNENSYNTQLVLSQVLLYHPDAPVPEIITIPVKSVTYRINKSNGLIVSIMSDGNELLNTTRNYGVGLAFYASAEDGWRPPEVIKPYKGNAQLIDYDSNHYTFEISPEEFGENYTLRMTYVFDEDDLNIEYNLTHTNAAANEGYGVARLYFDFMRDTNWLINPYGSNERSSSPFEALSSRTLLGYPSRRWINIYNESFSLNMILNNPVPTAESLNFFIKTDWANDMSFYYNFDRFYLEPDTSLIFNVSLVMNDNWVEGKRQAYDYTLNTDESIRGNWWSWYNVYTPTQAQKDGYYAVAKRNKVKWVNYHGWFEDYGNFPTSGSWLTRDDDYRDVAYILAEIAELQENNISVFMYYNPTEMVEANALENWTDEIVLNTTLENEIAYTDAFTTTVLMSFENRSSYYENRLQLLKDIMTVYNPDGIFLDRVDYDDGNFNSDYKYFNTTGIDPGHIGGSYIEYYTNYLIDVSEYLHSINKTLICNVPNSLQQMSYCDAISIDTSYDWSRELLFQNDLGSYFYSFPLVPDTLDYVLPYSIEFGQFLGGYTTMWDEFNITDKEWYLLNRTASDIKIKWDLGYVEFSKSVTTNGSADAYFYNQTKDNIMIINPYLNWTFDIYSNSYYEQVTFNLTENNVTIYCPSDSQTYEMQVGKDSVFNGCSPGCILPADTVSLSANGILCKGKYYINDADGTSGIFRLNGYTLNGNDAELIGDYSGRIALMTNSNSRLENLTARYYTTGLYFSGGTTGSVLKNVYLENTSMNVLGSGHYILNNTFKDYSDTYFSKDIQSSSDNIIANNIFDNDYLSLRIDSDRNLIENNTFKNYVKTFPYPLFLRANSNGNIIKYNNFTNNFAGINTEAISDFNTLIYGNRFFNITGYQAISLYSINNATVENNYANHNSRFIIAYENSTNIKIINNTLLNSTNNYDNWNIAIYLSSNTSNILIENNTMDDCGSYCIVTRDNYNTTIKNNYMDLMSISDKISNTWVELTGTGTQDLYTPISAIKSGIEIKGYWITPIRNLDSRTDNLTLISNTYGNNVQSYLITQDTSNITILDDWYIANNYWNVSHAFNISTQTPFRTNMYNNNNYDRLSNVAGANIFAEYGQGIREWFTFKFVDTPNYPITDGLYFNYTLSKNERTYKNTNNTIQNLTLYCPSDNQLYSLNPYANSNEIQIFNGCSADCIFPHDGLYISNIGDNLLCKGTYNLKDSDGTEGIIRFNSNGVSLDGNDATLVLDGSGVGINNYRANNYIRNITIKNADYAIRLSSEDNQSVYNTVLQDSSRMMVGYWGRDARIYNNTFLNTSLFLSTNWNMIIEDNLFQGQYDKTSLNWDVGVYAYSGNRNLTIQNNIFRNLMQGINHYKEGNDNNTYQNNTFEFVDTGIRFGESNISTKITIRWNNFSDMTGNYDTYDIGIRGHNTKNIDIYENNFPNIYKAAIWFANSSNIRFVNNTLDTLSYAERAGDDWDGYNGGGLEKEYPGAIRFTQGYEGWAWNQYAGDRSNNITILDNTFDSDTQTFLLLNGVDNLTHDLENYWYRSFEYNASYNNSEPSFRPLDEYEFYNSNLHDQLLIFQFDSRGPPEQLYIVAGSDTLSGGVPAKARRVLNFTMSKTEMTFKNVDSLYSATYNLTIYNGSLMYPYDIIRNVTPNTELIVSSFDQYSLSLNPNQEITISQSCSIPTDGETITTNYFMCDGTYNLPNGITLNSDDITIDCNGGHIISSLGRAFYSYNDNGYTIKNCIFETENNVALYINLGNNVLLDNVELIGGTSQSLYLRGVVNLTINNSIIGEGAYQGGVVDDGVTLGTDTQNLIIQNTLFDSHATYDDTIASGTVSDGLNVVSCVGCLFENLTFYNWGHTSFYLHSYDSDFGVKHNIFRNSLINDGTSAYNRGLGIDGGAGGTYNNTMYNIRVYNTNVRSQINGHNNLIYNISIINVSNSPRYPDGPRGQCLDIDDYGQGVAENNTFENITCENIASYALYIGTNVTGTIFKNLNLINIEGVEDVHFVVPTNNKKTQVNFINTTKDNGIIYYTFTNLYNGYNITLNETSSVHFNLSNHGSLRWENYSLKQMNILDNTISASVPIPNSIYNGTTLYSSDIKDVILPIGSYEIWNITGLSAQLGEIKSSSLCDGVKRLAYPVYNIMRPTPTVENPYYVYPYYQGANTCLIQLTYEGQVPATLQMKVSIDRENVSDECDTSYAFDSPTSISSIYSDLANITEEGAIQLWCRRVFTDPNYISTNIQYNFKVVG